MNCLGRYRHRRPRCEGCRSLHGRARGEEGFTLIEILVAGLLLAILAAPLMTMFLAAQSSHRLTRERTGADQLASTQIEYVRSLSYDSIGVPNGNPSGVIATPVTRSVTGGTMNVATSVTYVDDRVPGTLQTYSDYKRVTVTITRASDGKRLAQKTTNVSSPGAAPLGGVDYVTVKSNVLDAALATPVSSAGITLSSGGATVRTDTSNSAGSATFPALPAAAYDLAVSMPGYVTLKDDAAPAAPSTCPSTTCVKGYTWNSTIRVYKPSTITVFLRDASGNPFLGNTTVTAYSSRGFQTFSSNNQDSLTISSINGEPVVPNVAAGYTIAAQANGGYYSTYVNQNVPNSYPNDLTSMYTLTMNSYATRNLQITVKSKTGTAVSGASVQVSGGPAGTFLAGTTNSSGILTVSVPCGAQTYTVSASKGSSSGTNPSVSVPTGSGTVTVTTTVTFTT